MGREVRSGHWSHGSPRVDDLHREAGLQLQDPERLRGGPPQRHDPWLGLLRAPAEEVPAPDSLCRGGLQRHQACSAVGSRGPDRLRDVRALRPGRRPRLARTGEQDVEAADGARGLPPAVRPCLPLAQGHEDAAEPAGAPGALRPGLRGVRHHAPPEPGLRRAVHGRGQGPGRSVGLHADLPPERGQGGRLHATWGRGHPGSFLCRVLPRRPHQPQEGGVQGRGDLRGPDGLRHVQRVRLLARERRGRGHHRLRRLRHGKRADVRGALGQDDHHRLQTQEHGHAAHRVLDDEPVVLSGAREDVHGDDGVHVRACRRRPLGVLRRGDDGKAHNCHPQTGISVRHRRRFFPRTLLWQVRRPCWDRQEAEAGRRSARDWGDV
mmetsp:Transcript_34333/g.103471  ORF Transcript_34333/g.103471 Transcript_34333/m.103471 type:complete len:379 (-) Transcript_34333:740-1876(-)